MKESRAEPDASVCPVSVVIAPLTRVTTPRTAVPGGAPVICRSTLLPTVGSVVLGRTRQEAAPVPGIDVDAAGDVEGVAEVGGFDVAGIEPPGTLGMVTGTPNFDRFSWTVTVSFGPPPVAEADGVTNARNKELRSMVDEICTTRPWASSHTLSVGGGNEPPEPGDVVSVPNGDDPVLVKVDAYSVADTPLIVAVAAFLTLLRLASPDSSCDGAKPLNCDGSRLSVADPFELVGLGSCPVSSTYPPGAPPTAWAST